MTSYYLRLRKDSPQQGEYNPMQKMAYTSVFLLLAPLIMLSGMAMSPQLNMAFNWLPAMFGGRQSARTVHFILTFAFAAFVFGHVFMVLTTGVFNNMRSMITGWYSEKVPVSVEPAPKTIVEPQVEAAAPGEAANPPAAEGSAAVEPQEPVPPAPASSGATAAGKKTNGGNNDPS
jgi:hypothetical protein